MAKSSRRHRIKDGFRGMLQNLEWIERHADNVANLMYPEHPEIVDWCKSVYEACGMWRKFIADILEKI